MMLVATSYSRLHAICAVLCATAWIARSQRKGVCRPTCSNLGTPGASRRARGIYLIRNLPPYVLLNILSQQVLLNRHNARRHCDDSPDRLPQVWRYWRGNSASAGAFQLNAAAGYFNMQLRAFTRVELLALLGRQHREFRVSGAHQSPSLRGTNVSCKSFELQIIP